MKILVCISHVPDTNTKIKFASDGSSLDANGVTFVINPYDEFALTRAVEFQEADKSVEISVLCVGGKEVDATIRKALAVGGNQGVRIDAEPTDPYFTAKQIAEYAKSGNYDLIMTGKEAIDFNNAVVPGMVAEILGLPFVSFATRLELEGGKAKVKREITGGTELVETELPLVLSAQKGLAEWRIANMRGIMAARKKKINVITPVDAAPKVVSESYALPEGKGGVKIIEPDNVNELVGVLEEKGVI